MEFATNISPYGFHTSFDYALTNHLALCLHIKLLSSDFPFNKKGNTFEHNYMNLGLGYYKSLCGHLIMETYAGYGFGEYGYIWSSEKKYLAFNNSAIKGVEKVSYDNYYHQIFLKADIGCRFKYYAFGIGTNGSINFNISKYYYSIEGNKNNIGEYKDKQIDYLFVPIYIFAKVGPKHLKINTQAGFTPHPLKSSTNLYASIGLSLCF